MKTITNNNSTLTSHQQEVFNNIINDITSNVKNILKSNDIYDYLLSLSGPAGTGKTYLTTQIVKYFIENTDILDDGGLCVTAPTHKAVGVLSSILRENKIQASCRTIHSFLGIKPYVDYKTGEEKFTIDKTVKHPPRATLLIVDESSMISSNLYEYIIEAIEDERVNTVLFIGDPYQLLPVDNSTTNIFELKKQYKLEQIVRQAKDSYIIKIATQLRNRIKHQDFINLKDFFQIHQKDITFFHNQDKFLSDFYKNKDWYKEDKVLSSYTNQSVDGFNRRIRSKFWSQKGKDNPPPLLKGDMLRFKDSYNINEITLYHNGQEVTIEEATLKYQDSLQIEYWDCKVIGEPDQQIFRVVDPTSMKVFNDKLKFLANLAKKEKYRPSKQKLWKIFYATRDMFANVQYIFSSTIHKLQGSTYDDTYIDLFSLVDNAYMSDDEKYRLTYVAITRARNDIKIFMPSFTQTVDTIKSRLNTIENHNKTDDMLKDIFALYKK